MAYAARKGDKCMHAGPHCHAPIHPAAPVPTPVAHPAKPYEIKVVSATTVKINGKEAATVGAMTEPCMQPSCVPAGPGVISMGSMTVMMVSMPAARKGDMVAWAACVAPIPSPTGTVKMPCSSDVKVGG
ncbi:MAG TPA: PAAR domain-containing protein [Kofleriaceae bacterium]|jgi:uncharacterized Zn-binding protein involved in type VI secretion|nr:PAAR domain-containing protein [Kofleriaceae bacterium]